MPIAFAKFSAKYKKIQMQLDNFEYSIGITLWKKYDPSYNQTDFLKKQKDPANARPLEYFNDGDYNNASKLSA